MTYKNEGKIFETDIKKSVPEHIYCQRLHDSPSSFMQNSYTSYTVDNPYDFFLFGEKTFIALELKSTKHSSLSFWREDFEDKTKNKTFIIRKNQIKGLEKASGYNGIRAGFLINFRSYERTYWIDIVDFLKYTKKGKFNKKSINEDDIISMGGAMIPQEKKRVHWKYDIETLVKELANDY